MNHKTYAKQYPISPGQKTLIKIGIKELNITEADYRDMLAERYSGKRSCTDLTFSQAGHFIKELESKGFVIKPTLASKTKKQRHTAHIAHTRKPAERTTVRNAARTILISLVTPEEIDKLNEVAALIPWRLSNGLQLFLQNRMGIKDGRVKTSREAALAIEGLKKMFENGMKAANGADWWIMPQLNPAISKYIRIHLPERYRK